MIRGPIPIEEAVARTSVPALACCTLFLLTLACTGRAAAPASRAECDTSSTPESPDAGVDGTTNAADACANLAESPSMTVAISDVKHGAEPVWVPIQSTLCSAFDGIAGTWILTEHADMPPDRPRRNVFVDACLVTFFTIPGHPEHITSKTQALPTDQDMYGPFVGPYASACYSFDQASLGTVPLFQIWAPQPGEGACWLWLEGDGKPGTNFAPRAMFRTAPNVIEFPAPMGGTLTLRRPWAP